MRNYDLPPTKWPEISYAPMAGLPKITIPPMACCLGLEDSIEAYVAHMVLVFRGLWWVLRDDGVAWLNLGDSYVTSPPGNKGFHYGESRRANGILETGHKLNVGVGLKAKQLMGIPWRVAFALQADGWYLRSDIIWAKKNGLPESCQDRPTKAHEHLFLLAKSGKYWYDREAIREPIARNWNEKNIGKNNMLVTGIAEGKILGRKTMLNNGLVGNAPNPAGRNKRTVWSHIDAIAEHNEFFAFTLARLVSDHPELLDNILDEYGATSAEKADIWELATKPYKKAHFAVMPEALVEPCLLAGCPAQVCDECGKPWARMVEKTGESIPVSERHGRIGHNGQPPQISGNYWTGPVTKPTNQFSPQCTCNTSHHPGIVLDPFFGAGTVGVVAKKFKRDFIGIDLNSEYIKLAQERINATQPALFAR